MNELSKLLQENLNIEFISATLSNPKNKDGVQKVKVRPILKKDVLYFQLESFRNNQAFHENVEEKKACEILLKYMSIWKICARCRWRHKEQLIQFL